MFYKVNLCFWLWKLPSLYVVYFGIIVKITFSSYYKHQNILFKLTTNYRYLPIFQAGAVAVLEVVF